LTADRGGTAASLASAVARTRTGWRGSRSQGPLPARHPGGGADRRREPRGARSRWRRPPCRPGAAAMWRIPRLIAG